MRRNRIIILLLVVAVALLAFAPDAFASSTSGGQGWYGETNDKIITRWMFFVILFFPTIITVFSIIQWRLEKRKHARLDAAKRRAKNADWRGGW
jgi:preprotein translocase subunit SecG